MENYKIRYAKSLSDIDKVKAIADRNNDAKILGFILRSSLIENAKKHQLIVAETDGEIIGFINFNRRKKDNCTIIYEICVREDYRNHGVASKMIKNLIPPIELKCVTENTVGCQFYLRYGFKPIGFYQGKKKQTYNF